MNVHFAKVNKQVMNSLHSVTTVMKRYFLILYVHCHQ